MSRTAIILIALVAIGGILAGSHYAAFKAGRNAESVDRQDAIDAAVKKAREEFKASSDRVAKIDVGGREDIDDVSAEADRKAEEIAHVELSPEPEPTSPDQAPVFRCTDPRGPEYYRLRSGSGDHQAGSAEPASDVPGTAQARPRGSE